MSTKNVLLILAHPDDESFGLGGTISKLSRQNSEVYLLCATRGEVGKCGDPPICTQDQLGVVREQELREAAKILGIKQVEFLDYIDGQTDTVDSEEAVEKIINYINRIKPEVVITFGPDGISGHKDHVTVNKWATKAFYQSQNSGRNSKLYYITVPENRPGRFRLRSGIKMSPVTHKLNVEEFFEQKLKAIKCHKTQHLSWERHFGTDMEVLRQAFARECFYQVSPEYVCDKVSTNL